MSEKQKRPETLLILSNGRKYRVLGDASWQAGQFQKGSWICFALASGSGSVWIAADHVVAIESVS